MKGKFSHLLMALILPLPLLLASCISWPFGGSAPTVNSFTASPTTVSSGSSSVLSWSVSNATALIIDQGIGSVSAAGSSTVTPAATTTYTLTAVNASGTVTASTTVAVESGSTTTTTTTTTSPAPSGPLPVAHIYVNPGAISPAGTAVLSWDTANASNVSINHGIGPVSPSGSRSVSPNSTTVYVITASNAVGTVTASTQIVVGPSGTSANNWLASTYTREYHWPSCSIAQHIPMPSRVWFNTVNQAQAAGYHPCPVCHPPR
ncbi:MAG: Ada metal-binding domain-containing protein [Dehalococcoidia bacterium]